MEVTTARLSVKMEAADFVDFEEMQAHAVGPLDIHPYQYKPGMTDLFVTSCWWQLDLGNQVKTLGQMRILIMKIAISDNDRVGNVE